MITSTYNILLVAVHTHIHTYNDNNKYTYIAQMCLKYIGKRKLDLWRCFVGRADMYMRDGLHPSGKGAAVFADELSVGSSS